LTDQRMVVEVPARTVVKVLLIVAGFTVAAQIVAEVKSVLIYLALSLFLAVALMPAVRFFQRWLSHQWAVLVVFLCLLGVVAAIGALMVVPIATQFDDLTASVPDYFNKLERNDTVRKLDQRYDLLDRAERQIAGSPERAFGVAGQVVSGLLSTLTILFLTLFLMLELPRISSGVLAAMKPEAADRARFLAGEVSRTIGGYVAGALLIAVIAGSTMGVALWLLGVPYALALAVFMGLFGLIPLIGASIGAIGAIGVAAATGGAAPAIAMLVVVIIYQQLENHLIQPLVHRRTVQLSPVVIMVAILMGVTLLGVLGALIAIPVAGSIQIVVKDLVSGWVGMRNEETEPPIA
jgi:predicted PurR-regulated permease PerM